MFIWHMNCIQRTKHSNRGQGSTVRVASRAAQYIVLASMSQCAIVTSQDVQCLIWQINANISSYNFLCCFNYSCNDESISYQLLNESPTILIIN